MFDAPMRGIAGHLAQQGRYGDSTLVHMNPMEVQALASLSPTGQLTTNPVTGQPEAFLLSGLGSLLGNALFGGMLGPQLASVLGSAATTGLVTGDLKKGLMAGISGYGFGNAISEAMKAASPEVIADIASSEAVDQFTPENVLTSQIPSTEMIPQEPSLLPKTPSLTGPTAEFAQLASQVPSTIEPTFFERFKQPFSSKEGIGAFMSSLSKPGTMLPIYVGEGNIAAMDAMKARKRYAKKLGADRENELRRARMGLYGALQGIQRDYPGLNYTYGQGYSHGGHIKKMARGRRTEDEVPPVVLPDPISVQAGLRGSGINTPPPVDYSALHQGGGGGYMPGLAPEFMYFGSGTGGGGNSGVLPPPGSGGSGPIFGGNQPSPGTAGPTNPYDLGGLLSMYFNAPRSDEEDVEEDVNLEEMFQPEVVEPNVNIPSFDPSILQTINPLNYVSQPVKKGIVDVFKMFPAVQGVKLIWNGVDWVLNTTGLGDLPDDPLGVVDVEPPTVPTQEELDAAADNSGTSPARAMQNTLNTVTPYSSGPSYTSGGGMSPLDFGSNAVFSYGGGSNLLKRGYVELDEVPYAEGGLTTGDKAKRYQEGGPVMMDEPVDAASNMEMMLSDMEQSETIDPRSEYDQLVNMTVAAIKGEIEEGADRIIEAFVAEYGPEAFAQLRDAVLNQIVPGAQTEGLIDGNGGGMDDEVDGMIGSEQRVAVSPGEYIIPADVVSGLGDGSTDAGASILDEMLDSIRMARTGTTKQPEPLFS